MKIPYVIIIHLQIELEIAFFLLSLSTLSVLL